jgi:biotin carboxyl carrier protein
MSAIDVRVDGKTVMAEVEGQKTVRLGQAVFTVKSLGGGRYRVREGDRHWIVSVAVPDSTTTRLVFVDGVVGEVELANESDRAATRKRAASHDLSSPMPATVLRVLVDRGARVTAGSTLIVLEAMKMELPIRAPRDGVVKAIHCEPGELVQPGIDLLELE